MFEKMLGDDLDCNNGTRTKHQVLQGMKDHDDLEYKKHHVEEHSLGEIESRTL